MSDGTGMVIAFELGALIGLVAGIVALLLRQG